MRGRLFGGIGVRGGEFAAERAHLGAQLGFGNIQRAGSRRLSARPGECRDPDREAQRQ
jgi:hypothetical protein